MKRFSFDSVVDITSYDARDITDLCYACFGKEPSFVNVSKEIEQRNYFSFYDYDYELDVQKMQAVYPNTIPFEEGLKESSEWYRTNEEAVNKKAYFAYIDENLT